MRNQKGFTLIELVVVIVILGILAAVAVPKFVDMQVDARLSVLDGMYGAVQSASSLSHAQALVKGKTAVAAADQLVVMEGDNVLLNYGYPTTAGIENAVNVDGFTFAGGVFTLQTDCIVTYVQTGSAGVAPTITKTITGCN